MWIYGANLIQLSVIILLVCIIWCIIYNLFKKIVLFKFLMGLLALVSLYGVVAYTIMYRQASNDHIIVFAVAYNSEFYREMFMNMLLYFPLGLTLSALIGSWTILIALVLSFTIETWQYFTGAGMAQGTDVIMNTFGAALGTLPCIINMKKVRARFRGDRK